MARYISTSRDGDVFLIGLNRPETRNGMNMAMINELAMAFGEFEKDQNSRVGVLHALGDHFCAGLELTDCAEPLMTPRSQSWVPEGGLDPWGILTDRPQKPVIAATKGFCMTVGVELCLAADIVVASDDVKFGQLEVTRGVFPFGGATLRWPLASGYQNAMRYLLTGDVFGAEEAKRIGIVQDVTTSGELLEYAVAMAKRIAANAPLGVKCTLRTARRMQDHGQKIAADTLYPEARSMFSSDDAEIGIKTYLDKERPSYTGT